MKRFLSRFLRLIVLLCVPGFLYAQQTDYRILLHSGKFTPEANVNALTKNSPVLQQSKFANKHYVTIQFHAIPSDDTKARMRDAGIVLVDYIPNLAYTATINSNISTELLKSFPLRSIFKFTPVQKTIPAVMEGKLPAHAVKSAGTVDVTVITYEKLAAASIIPSLDIIGASVIEDMPTFRRFTVRVPVQKLSSLVALSFIQWVEFIDPPNYKENLPGRTLHRVNVLNDGVRNLKGDNIAIGIWDVGAIGSHLDFLPASRVTQVEVTSADAHSTHCAGTILGRGLLNPVAKGMAPNASLFSYNFNGNIQNEMATGIPAHNLVVSSHSYGSGTPTCSPNGAGISYSATAQATDINLNNFPNHLHVHSAGNSQAQCAGGWYTITSSGKPAKNNIVVADITTNENLSSSSSCGPVQDGRVKPEISAMGTNVFSTVPGNTYQNMSGTSMATPAVAGTVALLVQRYKQLNGDALPPSSLIKNVLLNGAKDLGNAGPDYRYGFGRVNALISVKMLEEARYIVNTMTNAGTLDIPIAVPAGASRLKVMLTWNDPAGAANANPALVNNLDLSVIEGANTTLPWKLDPANPSLVAIRGVDIVSNIEQVTLDAPANGNYTIRIQGTAIPVGPQEFTVSWTIDQPHIEVIYPNGNETFNPGTNETITWDHSGVTGNQTIEYSLNNGGSWTALAIVGPTINRQSWSIPAGANTSTALVRISSGSLMDVSDANFKILGTTTGFTVNGASCTAGDISFTWTAMADATHYDIYRLNEVSGTYTLLASDLTGTSHTVSGQTPGSTMWFHIVAKNNSTGAQSSPSLAVSGTVSSGGGGLGAIGAISGLSQICGNPSSVGYSLAAVSGATLYSWTAPPGATIISGQGTTSININYGAGSSSGNVSVFASNGSCLSPTVTLAVNVGPGTVAAPTSGGDQAATACPPNPIPTLTASATVPAGHTIIWYSAATGGSVVASPILNSVGTVTYYAASRNTASGCESNTRSAVTLIINTAPPPIITAGGPITFCDGGSVILTANAGSSYSWSNGASTQSITVSTAGSYSVTVTQAGGCTGTSAATVVTVNPIPAATITANGNTTFCSNDNVVLTASAGSSWLWSNGATTQSITLNESGSFTVRVTNASGCFATSSATTTTVSPSPVVSISAAPYTNLFPGLTTNLTAIVTPPGSYTYAWFKNGVAVSGATGSTLTGIDLDDLGSYTVRVNNTTGLACTSLSAARVIGDSSTARLFIYPSPNTGQFQVTYYTTGAVTGNTLTIFDSKGSLVFSRVHAMSSSFQRIDVDMRRFGKGVYRVVLSNKSGKKLADGSVVIQ